MDQIINVLAGWFWSIMCMLMPFIIIDLVFLKGRLTRRLGQGLQYAIVALIELPFRLVGAILRAIWRGMRGQRNQQNQPNQVNRVEHHHYFHRQDEDEDDEDEED